MGTRNQALQIWVRMFMLARW